MVARNPTCLGTDCSVQPGQCCPCTCETICVTLTLYGDDSISTELDWDSDDQWFLGSLGGRDLLFYFERDEEGCWFNLRSEAFGFPEGYEFRWKVPEEISCSSLAAAVDTEDGLLSFECVEKITPATCSGCRCLCECLCATVVRTVDDVQLICTGKLCWDETEQSYKGTVTCDDEYATEYDIAIIIGPKGRYCDDYSPGTVQDGCDPCDTTCVIVLNISVLGIDNEWQELTEPCEDRNLNYSWSLEDPEDPYNTIDVTIHCTVCHQTCTAGPFPCECRFDGGPLPAVWIGSWAIVPSDPCVTVHPMVSIEVPDFGKVAWNESDCHHTFLVTYRITAFPPLCTSLDTSTHMTMVCKNTSEPAPYIDNALV